MTMNDIKEDFNKDLEILKNQITILEMESSISQTKTSVEIVIVWITLETEYQDKMWWIN
jgi:hypothetical protein